MGKPALNWVHYELVRCDKAEPKPGVRYVVDHWPDGTYSAYRADRDDIDWRRARVMAGTTPTLDAAKAACERHWQSTPPT